MPQIVRTKYWTMVLLNPTFVEQDTLQRRLKRLQFGIYGGDQICEHTYMFEAMCVFPKKISYQEAKRFFRRGNWTAVNDVADMLLQIEQYEYCKSYGTFAIESVQENLNGEFINVENERIAE